MSHKYAVMYKEDGTEVEMLKANTVNDTALISVDGTQELVAFSKLSFEKPLVAELDEDFDVED